MAQPRVFVSSTYYDLKYVRSSLELFIESLGFVPVLSESGDVAYEPGRALDESCYREVQNSDIYVLIVGGRYGSRSSATSPPADAESSQVYDSVTKMEFQAAAENDMPMYVLIERSVHAEYQTYLRNRDTADVSYAHVDDVNVYRFIEYVGGQRRNTPVQPFERYADIEQWLRLQWAGLFREMLARASSERQLASLAAQVTELAELNKTLTRYVEVVVSKLDPDDAVAIIRDEHRRLADVAAEQKLRNSPYLAFLQESYGVPLSLLRSAIEQAQNIANFRTIIATEMRRRNPSWTANTALDAPPGSWAWAELNGAREALGAVAFREADWSASAG